jgi:hypothetical protein
MMVGIYKINVSERLESVENFAITERNKELIVDFIDYCFSEGLGEHRIVKYITTLKYISLSLQIDFEKTTERDIRRYVSSLERSNKSQWTKHDYKVVMKKFYGWLNGGEEPSIVNYPPLKWQASCFVPRTFVHESTGSIGNSCRD